MFKVGKVRCNKDMMLKYIKKKIGYMCMIRLRTVFTRQPVY